MVHANPYPRAMCISLNQPSDMQDLIAEITWLSRESCVMCIDHVLRSAVSLAIIRLAGSTYRSGENTSSNCYAQRLAVPTWL